MRSGWFAAWAVVGALGALTAIGVFSIGVFVAPFFLGAGVLVARRARHPLDALGLVVGIGVVCIVVAAANGDSHPCVDGATSCSGLDPGPWWRVGGALVGAGVAGYVALRVLSRIYPCRRAAK